MRIGLPRSLTGQVLLLLLVVAMLAALALPFAVSTMLRQTTADFEGRVLTEKGRTFARLLLPQRESDPCIGGVRDVSPLVQDEEGLALLVVTSGHAVIAHAGKIDLDIASSVPLERDTRFFELGSVLGISRPLGTSGCAWLVVTQDTAAPQFVADDIVRTFLRRFALLLLPLLLLVPLLGALLMWRMTRRLHQVSATAAAIGPKTPAIRLPLVGLPSEVRPLADATNRALDRLAEGLRTQSEFASNVAHELRNPLALIRLRVQGMSDGQEKEQLLHSVERATRVVTQLLALVDLERPIEEIAVRFRPHELVEQFVIDKAPAIFAAGHAIGLDEGGENATRFGHPELLQLAIENLVDNAVRHTPAGTTITLSVSGRGAISVEDDGPGIPAADLENLTRRHWRADTARGDGAGIGLSIVDRIASLGDGRLDIGRGAENRGARFTLEPGPEEVAATPA